jgi:hypothetical protein
MVRLSRGARNPPSGRYLDSIEKRCVATGA